MQGLCPAFSPAPPACVRYLLGSELPLLQIMEAISAELGPAFWNKAVIVFSHGRLTALPDGLSYSELLIHSVHCFVYLLPVVCDQCILAQHLPSSCIAFLLFTFICRMMQVWMDGCLLQHKPFPTCVCAMHDTLEPVGPLGSISTMMVVCQYLLFQSVFYPMQTLQDTCAFLALDVEQCACNCCFVLSR